MLYPFQNNVRNKLDLSGLWDFWIDPVEVGEQNGWFNGFPDARPMAVTGTWNEQYENIFDSCALRGTSSEPTYRGIGGENTSLSALAGRTTVER